MIVGCGDVGGCFGEVLLVDGWWVYGLCCLVDVLLQGILLVVGDLQVLECFVQWLSELFDYLVYSVVVSQYDEVGYCVVYVDGLCYVLGWLQVCGQWFRCLLFVFSIGVYVQIDGGWIDEELLVFFQVYFGWIMFDVEQVVLDSGILVICVCLVGIYGLGWEWLFNQVCQGYWVVSELFLYVNWIYVDDVVGLLVFLLCVDVGGQVLEDCYIGVDDVFVVMYEVVDYLCQCLGVS